MLVHRDSFCEGKGKGRKRNLGGLAVASANGDRNPSLKQKNKVSWQPTLQSVSCRGEGTARQTGRAGRRRPGSAAHRQCSACQQLLAGAQQPPAPSP